MLTCKTQENVQTVTGVAFTLIELVVVIGLLAILVSIFLPALANTRPNVQALQCMNNHRRLATAWRMYADDSLDMLVYASENSAGNPLNQYAWASPQLDHVPNNTGNWDTNADMVKRPLWPYSGKDATCYRCPADHSSAVLNGISTTRARSFAMNLFQGGYAGTDGGTGSKNRLFLKFADLTAPGPAKTFVFMDTRSDEINFDDFLVEMSGFPNQPVSYQFNDFPGFFHNLGCSFSFGDGHAEVHPWLDLRTVPPIGYNTGIGGPIYPSPRNLDIAWLQDHATRPK